jgi:hypothetical protein
MSKQPPKDPPDKGFSILTSTDVTVQDQQVSELQKQLVDEKDARKEDRFVFIVLIVLLLDVVFFTVMPTFGGPLALLILELLVLIPLAKRMGMEEIAEILSRVLHRVADKAEK